jgi:MFS family permease
LIIIGTGMTFIAFQWFGRLGGSSIEYYACWCMYMLGYFLAGPIPHQIIISNWFKQRRGFAMGITYVGVGVVGAIGNKVGPWMVNQMRLSYPPEGGWESWIQQTMAPVVNAARGGTVGLTADDAYTTTLKTLSFLLLFAWPLALLVIKDKPQDVDQLPDGKQRAADVVEPVVAPPKTFGVLMSQSSFWLLLVGSAASIGSIAAVNFLLKFVLEEQGFVEQAARDAVWSQASSVYLISSIGGRLLAGWLADKFPRKLVMLVTYIIVAISIPLLFLITPGQPGFVYVFAICFGFALGADYMLIPLMAADQFGLTSLGKAMSAILPSDTISQFWFPRIVAELRTLWGGYSSALWAVFAMAALGAAAIGLLPRNNPRDEEE